MTMETDLNERSIRVGHFLDKCCIPKGRKRASALVDILGCTPFTARRILAGNLPRPETMHKLISVCNNKLEKPGSVKDTIKQVFYGGIEGGDLILMGYATSSVEVMAVEMGINLASFNEDIRENLWLTVYDDANENMGQVDQKVVKALLVNLKKNSNTSLAPELGN